MMSTTLRTAGKNSLPTVICTDSKALPMPRMEPARVSFIALAVLSATPSTLESVSKSLFQSPFAFCSKTETPAIASSPKTVFRAAICAALPMLFMLAAISRKIVIGFFRLPAASCVVTPSFFSVLAASPVGAASLFSIPLRTVPPWLALMPLFARIPAIVAVSSRLNPAVLATGPTYFMVSPSISILVLALLQVAVSTSATWPISAALMPKADMMSLEISAARPRSVAVAAAKLRTPGRAAILSLTEKPAIARYCSAWPTSEAVNCVVAPSSRAAASRACISECVARETAPTLAIWSSKLAAVATHLPNAPTISAPPAASGPIARARLPMRVESPAVARSTFLSPPWILRRGLEIMSTNERVAKTLKTSMTYCFFLPQKAFAITTAKRFSIQTAMPACWRHSSRSSFGSSCSQKRIMASAWA